jgi:hypothetical protein
MKPKNQRLIPLSTDDLKKLQAEADELAELQKILNRLPMGLQVETLSEEALMRLREVAADPDELLSGPNLLLWNNVCRCHAGLARQI